MLSVLIVLKIAIIIHSKSVAHCHSTNNCQAAVNHHNSNNCQAVDWSIHIDISIDKLYM